MDFGVLRMEKEGVGGQRHRVSVCVCVLLFHLGVYVGVNVPLSEGRSTAT